MRFALRACLTAVLIGTLVNLPIAGAAEKPLGTVTQSQAARLDRAAAAVGATVYPGDTLTRIRRGRSACEPEPRSSI